MGSFFPWLAHSKRRLRLLLRTDFHLLRCFFADFFDFCRKSDVQVGKKKHYESGDCLVSNSKHNVYRTELGLRAVDLLHNESSWKNNIGDRCRIDVDRSSW